MARTEGRSRGELEREVLACLAAAGRPLTPAQVQAELAGGLAYTTVMTTLSRLAGKHALQRTPQGRGYAYALTDGPEGARANVTAHQMLKLLDAGSDRVGVLTRFVADLNPEDEKLLTDLLSRSVDPGSTQT